ncbi:acetyl-CoA synthetase-like protein [Meira miltonrushii]|uniref:Acetyl-CoA synthetase-like protein n=1 Tax=Meira miltonrushii TaxID=1280837 RepID=A0A316VPV9_9BASI|nr:acetyl-CoA synthetase-like protein [Meira miltonrushii]PWN38191.1 acetyl-CoA synthetase-like protein [Meira miltonrushii]
MTKQPGDRLAVAIGPKADLPAMNLAQFAFSNPFQHSPNTYASPSTKKINKGHSFDGLPIPPQSTIMYDAKTGAAITWERLRGDSLRMARSINALVGPELPFDGQDNDVPIHSPRTTVMVCLPNCMPYASIVLGAWSALCTVTTVNYLLMPDELAHILAKARPQLIFCAAGEEGEERMWQALERVHNGKVTNLTPAIAERAQKWAKELASVWQAQRTRYYQRGDLPPNAAKRVFTVNVGATHAGGVDYYGSSARKDGASALSDPNDWSHLLSPPQGHKQSGALDSLSRPAFAIRKLSRAEQRRRTALILWSSGTTGPSKGVLLSHFGFISSIYSGWTSLPILHGPTHGGERWIAMAPWSHMYGLTVILIPAITTGATVIIPANPRFDLKDYLSLVQLYRITHMHISPPVVVHLRNLIVEQKRQGKLNPKILDTVRAICCGGAPTSNAAIQTIFNAMGKPVHQAYGSTEAGSTSHATATDYEESNTAAQMEIGSVGAPMTNVEIAIHAIPGCLTAEETKRRRQDIILQVESTGLDGKKRLHALHEGLPGEIWVRAGSNMQGYYSGLGSDDNVQTETFSGALDLTNTTNSITKDGWFKTGDEGVLDAHGQLWIVGRLKELIKVKGFQVAPVELDSVFGKHEEVNDAAAVGVLDADQSEEICMYVVPNQTSILQEEKAQKEFVQRLTNYIVTLAVYYKWPKYFVICDKIIKNPSGKILRKDLHTIKGIRHIAPRPSQKMPVMREARL